MKTTIPIESVKVSAYKVPTDAPESDGTLAWNSTTLVLVEISAGGKTGLGYTYSHKACATLIQDKLAPLVEGKNALDQRHWWEMLAALRNLGHPGIASMAVAAVDVALWDLKARLLEVPLVTLLGKVRSRVPIYGSGGFTSYSIEQLQRQLGDWVDAGIPRVKMKIGRHPADDPKRMRAARTAIGSEAELFVDANGGYDRKQALAMAALFPELGVSWYEEPVTSDDVEGLRLLRDRVDNGIEITAGEYGFTPGYFRHMLETGAVDVLQADLTRCAGISGFLKTAALCDAYQTPLSAHTAPALHLHPGCCVKPLRHLEYFHDHVRIETLLFDGVCQPQDGTLAPDLSRPGLGLDFKHQDARRYRV